MLLFEMSGASTAVVPSNGLLLGRRTEREALDRLLGGAREGRGAVLVLHGEGGVGKTALLDDVAEAAADFRIARMCGGRDGAPLRGGPAVVFPVPRVGG